MQIFHGFAFFWTRSVVAPAVGNRNPTQGIPRPGRGFGDVIGDRGCALRTSSRCSQVVSLNPGQHRCSEGPGHRDISRGAVALMSRDQRFFRISIYV